VPATVVIPAGQTQVVFFIDAVNDNLFDGTQTVTITASAAGLDPAARVLSVDDHEVVTVTANAANRSQNASTITIAGTGFSPTAEHNTVAFNLGAAGTVTSATATQLIVTFTTLPTSLGALMAVVTTNTWSSGDAVQVATVVDNTAPTAAAANLTLFQSDSTVTLAGSDAETPAANLVYVIDSLPAQGRLVHNGTQLAANSTITGGPANLTYELPFAVGTVMCPSSTMSATGTASTAAPPPSRSPRPARPTRSPG
jgi:hypothetical protein